jgi:hypothetical protein
MGRERIGPARAALIAAATVDAKCCQRRIFLSYIVAIGQWHARRSHASWLFQTVDLSAPPMCRRPLKTRAFLRGLAG